MVRRTLQHKACPAPGDVSTGLAQNPARAAGDKRAAPAASSPRTSKGRTNRTGSLPAAVQSR